MFRYYIERNGNLDGVAVEFGGYFFFLRNDSDLTEDEVRALEAGNEPQEVFFDEYVHDEWYVSREMLDYSDFDFELLRGLIDETEFSWFSDELVQILLDSVLRGGVVHYTGSYENDAGRIVKSWDYDTTQGVEFMEELRTGREPRLERLVWMIEAWARHQLTDYDILVKEAEDVNALREEKTKEGVQKLLEQGGPLAEDYKKLIERIK